MPTLRSRPSKATSKGSIKRTDPSESADYVPTSARRFYDTHDVRQIVLSLLDFSDLARMLRLEKAITASIAGILYKEVNLQQMSRMSRGNPRRATYCNAVRVLDRSPRPAVNPPDEYRLNSYPKITPFDPVTLLANLATWRKKYPNLSTVHYRYPTNEDDDSYSFTIASDGKLAIELESRVLLNAYGLPPPHPGCPALPPTPVVEGMDIHHTIAIRMVSDMRLPVYGSEDERNRLWKEWLYGNPALDRRVTSIDHSAIFRMPFNLFEMAQFVCDRVSDECESITQLLIPLAGTCPLDLFHKTILLLDPLSWSSIHTVTIHARYLCTYESEMQIALSLFDRALPSLELLTITGSLPDSVDMPRSLPLSGMAKLRLLTLECGKTDGPDGMKYRTPEIVARYICRLGSRNCTYRLSHPELTNNPLREKFDKRVKELRATADAISDEMLKARLASMPEVLAAIEKLFDDQDPECVRIWALMFGPLAQKVETTALVGELVE